MHPTTKTLFAASFTVTSIACGPRALPSRSSPSPTPATAVRLPTAPSRLEALTERFVLDAESGEVMAFDERGEARVVVRIPSLPIGMDWMYAAEDGTVLVRDRGLVVYPPGAASYVVQGEIRGMAAASANAIWVVRTTEGSAFDHRLCRVADGALACVAEVPVPATAGYDLEMAVTDVGVYLTDRSDGLYRWDGTALRRLELPTTAGAIRGFRQSPEGVLAIGDDGVYSIRGEDVRRTWNGYAMGVAPVAAGGYVVAQFDSETVQVDPSCSGGWFTSCERRSIWQETVYTLVTGSAQRELGHESCDYDATMEPCAWTSTGLVAGRDRLWILGEPTRTLGLGSDGV